MIRQLSVFVENKPGSLMEVTSRLNEAHVNIRAVASFDTTLTYEKLEKICTFIANGAVFLSTHLDLVCPTETGFIPDCGSMCALITKSTGVEPKYLGKPFPETMEMILAITGHKKEDVAFPKNSTVPN